MPLMFSHFIIVFHSFFHPLFSSLLKTLRMIIRTNLKWIILQALKSDFILSLDPTMNDYLKRKNGNILRDNESKNHRKLKTNSKSVYSSVFRWKWKDEKFKWLTEFPFVCMRFWEWKGSNPNHWLKPTIKPFSKNVRDTREMWCLNQTV